MGIFYSFAQKKSFLSFKLFTTDPQEKSYLPNRLTMLYMVIEKILPPTFVTEWTPTDYCEMSDFFFWLIFLVSPPPSMTSLRFPHSSCMININLGKFSKFSMSSISTPFSSSSTITTFSEGLFSSMKPWFNLIRLGFLRKVFSGEGRGGGSNWPPALHISRRTYPISV